MFALRDQLRNYAFDEVIDPESRLYNLLQERINNTVDYLYLVDIKVLFDARRFLKGNPSVLKKIEKNRRLVESCELTEVQEIDRQIDKFLCFTLLANSACFFIWSILLILILLAIHRTGKTLWKSVKDLVFDLTCVPEREMIKFTPKIV